MSVLRPRAWLIVGVPVIKILSLSSKCTFSALYTVIQYKSFLLLFRGLRSEGVPNTTTTPPLHTHAYTHTHTHLSLFPVMANLPRKGRTWDSQSLPPQLFLSVHCCQHFPIILAKVRNDARKKQGWSYQDKISSEYLSGKLPASHEGNKVSRITEPLWGHFLDHTHFLV